MAVAYSTNKVLTQYDEAFNHGLFRAPFVAGFHAQVFAYVKRSKNMSENLIFARNKVFEQFFEAKYMSKKMSNLKGAISSFSR